MMGVVIMLVTVVVVRPKRDRNDGHMEIMGMFLAKRGRNRGGAEHLRMAELDCLSVWGMTGAPP